MRAIFIFLCFVAGGVAAYFGQPYVRDNTDATLIIITVLTVFAGFLVAIITILGDPSMIPDGGWRAAEVRRESVEARLITHIWLFVIYLIAIGLLFASAILVKTSDKVVSEAIKIWIERAYLFAGVSAFLLTFGLPKMLLRIQLGRLEAEITRRRRNEGIKDD